MENRKRAPSRRDFIRSAGLSGLALTIGAYVPVSDNMALEIVNAQAADTQGIESWKTMKKPGAWANPDYRPSHPRCAMQFLT